MRLCSAVENITAATTTEFDAFLARSWHQAKKESNHMTKRISSGPQIIAAEILFIVSDEKHGLSALSKSAPPTKQRTCCRTVHGRLAA